MTIAHLTAVAVLALVLLIPGLVVGAAGGLRGWLLVGGAPVLTYGVVALTSTAFDGFLPDWSPLTLGLGTAVLAAVVLLVRLAASRVLTGFQDDVEMPSRWDWRHHVGVTAGIATAGVVGLGMAYRGTRHFGGIHQFWDAMFHVNAVRYIADSGQAAPGALRAIASPDFADYFYPDAYHVLVATARQITGAPIEQLVNLHAGLFGAVLGLVIAALVRVVNGRPALAAASAFVCGGISSFPAGLLYFGPLWPFGTAVTMIPSFLVLFVAAVRSRRLPLLVATALGAIGLSAVHPSAALSAGVFGGLFLVFRWVAARRVPLREIGALAIVGVLAAGFVVPQYLAATKTAAALPVSWPVFATPGAAVGKLVFLDNVTNLPQWWLVVPMLIGIASLRKLRELHWLAAAGGVFTLLFMTAAAYKSTFAISITQPWWNDAWRFAALVAIAQAVLIGHGLVAIRDWLIGLRPVLAPRPLVRVAALVVLLAVVAAGADGLYWRSNSDRVLEAYSDGPTVNGNERIAMAELPGLVPAGSVVMNDPLDGSPWMWALDGVRPVYGHALILPADANTVGPERMSLYLRFNRIDTDPAIRALVTRLDIQYVYTGDGFAASGVRAPGLRDLGGVRSLELVYSNDNAKIYRVRRGPAT